MTEQELYNPEREPVEEKVAEVQNEVHGGEIVPEVQNEVPGGEIEPEDGSAQEDFTPDPVAEEPEPETLPSNEIEITDPYEAIQEAAYTSATVGSFMAKLSDLAFREDSVGPLEDARKNLSAIVTGYENFSITRNLTSNGKNIGGVAEGGRVQIDADLLAGVYDKETAKEIHRTFVHEKEHTEQVHFSPYGPIVVDPKSNEEITSEVLDEGGAEYASAERVGGGKQSEHITNSTDPDLAKYRKGFDLYRSHVPDDLNRHVRQDGSRAGDRVSLQATLAEEAGVEDTDKLLDLAEKAGFSDEEKEKLLKETGSGEPPATTE